ncbi:hypothetical protein [Qipengyuania atrilutea]|uniref:Uncharacterized protein n=1 Tax=Qipengyuania atrilutea TaxID=2744473 RepID=A0A850H5S5_9SPHN|nr:hypothetical protein [Actirhodobacter atriluteus]NVD45847.1 hypothetical protein [Actirhodobacter atriluteus]
MLYQKIDLAIASVKPYRPELREATLSLFADDYAYRDKLVKDCERSGLRLLHNEAVSALLSRPSFDALGEIVVVRVGELTAMLTRRLTEIDRFAADTGKRLYVVCEPAAIVVLRAALHGLTTEVLARPSRWERMFRLGQIRAEIRQNGCAR